MRLSMPAKISKDRIASYWEQAWSCIVPRNLCWGCLQQLPLTRAHILARQYGGIDDVSNLLMMCKTCNWALDDLQQRKGTLAAIEWVRINVVTSRPHIPPQMLSVLDDVISSQNDVTPIESVSLALDAYLLYCRTRT